MLTGCRQLVPLYLTALLLTACGGSGSTGVTSSVSSVAPAAVPPCGIEGTGIHAQDCNGPGLDQPPTSSYIFPSCAPVGAGAFTLTVQGSEYFAPGSVVQWNGNDRPTTVGGTYLNAEISASDIAVTGTVTITVNPPPSAGNFSTATFTISAGGVNPQSVAVDPTGKFAYVANTGCPDSFVGSVSMYTINATTGVLTSLGSPVDADFGPHSVAVDPAGKFVYVANDGDYEATGGSVSSYTIDATTGALKFTGTIAAPCGPPGGAGSCAPYSVAVHPSGQFVYVANEGGFSPTSISMYTINATTGALTQGDLIAAEGRAIAVTVDQSGKFAYVASWSAPRGASGKVSTYSISAATGALTPVGTISAGIDPVSVVLDGTGNHAYVVNSGSNDISMYTVDATLGTLTSTGVLAAGTGPSSVAVTPGGRFAYVAGSNSVSMYAIDATTGTLTSIGVIAAGTNPVSVAVDPTGKFAYVANSGSNDVSMYRIDAATGALTLIGTVGT